MAWTAPTTRSTGDLISASIWNTDLVENLKYFKDSPVFDGDISVGDDLLLTSSGAVINFNGGDVTITHASNQLAFAGAATAYSFSDGRVLIGTTTARTLTALDSLLQVETAGSTYQQLSLVANRNDTGGASIILGKSRGTTVNSNTVVVDGDNLGFIRFQAADGVDMDSIAAQILAQVDGSPGSDDTPGRLIFSTAADGASSVTERMRITSAGNVGIGMTPGSVKLDILGATSIRTSSSETNAANKEGKYVFRHYTNAEEDAMFAYVYSTSAVNEIYIGGGSSSQNAATQISFLTAANNTTVSGTERMRIPAAGGVQAVTTISVGNATPAATGAGITFPAAQSASSDANTLDDYEEGNWTPAVRGSGTAGTYELATASGTYTKIGRQVSIMCFVQFAAAITGGGTGYLQLTGFPFSNSNYASAAVVNKGLDLDAGYTWLVAAPISQSGVTTWYFSQNGDNVNDATLPIAAVSASDYFWFSATYFV